MNLTLSVRQGSFDSLAAWWAGLAARRPGLTVFDTPAWQRVWWEEFGGGAALRLVTICEEGEEPALLCPLMERNGVISFLGGSDLVDFHDFLASGTARQAHVGALVKHLGDEYGCRAVDLLSLPENSCALRMFPPAAESQGWRTETVKEDVAPRMGLPPTFDEYMAGLDKKNRHELRRKMRRIEAAGELKQQELRSPTEISEGVDDFLTLHRKSTPEKAEFMTPAREGFFRRVSAALAQVGVSRLRFLELDGKRVAGSLSFVTGGTRYLYNSGYDPAYRDLAVGLMNHAYSIRASIAEGIGTFDFMRGSEPYKYHLGGADRAVFRVTARR